MISLRDFFLGKCEMCFFSQVIILFFCETISSKYYFSYCTIFLSKYSINFTFFFCEKGHVGPTEASVVIAVSSPHRADSLEAVHFAIDELKATVPIWKKEQYSDGSEWKENKECFFSTSSQSGGQLQDAQAGRVDPNYVQIHATKEEVDERIEAFIAVKRSDNDKGI